MRLEADGGGRRCWKLDGDSSSDESLCGRFLIRDDDPRFDGGVWDVGGALIFSMISDTKHEASDVVEECLVLTA